MMVSAVVLWAWLPRPPPMQTREILTPLRNSFGGCSSAKQLSEKVEVRRISSIMWSREG